LDALLHHLEVPEPVHDIQASRSRQIWSAYDTMTALVVPTPFASSTCLVVEQIEDLQT
jgi:hypothetical protein